jgi:hypothetical protein
LQRNRLLNIWTEPFFPGKKNFFHFVDQIVSEKKLILPWGLSRKLLRLNR